MTSANIVGYSTCDAPAPGKYKALSVDFENVGTEKAIPIKNVVTVADPKGGASADVTASDQIWLWNSSAGDWTKYYYRQLGTRAAVGWCLNGQATVTEETVNNGDTMFFFRGTGGAQSTTLILSGGVREFVAKPQVTNLEAGKYRAIGYPWPVDMPIAGFEKYQGAPKGGASADVTASDQIWRWDTTAGDWNKYYYRKLGTREAVGWCLNGQSTVTEHVIPAGEGFFFFRGTGGATDTITFTYEEKKAE